MELSIWLLAFAIGIRCFEVLLLTNNGVGNFSATILWNLTGLCHDISLILRLTICSIIVFIVFSFLSENITRIVFRIFISVMILFSLICILFFSTSGFLLDKVVFTYSIEEMWNIVMSSGKSPVWVYITMLALPVLFYVVSGIRIKINRGLLVFFAVLTLSSFFIFKEIPKHTNQYHIKVNKAHFFWKSMMKKQIQAFKENDDENISAIEDFRNYFPEHQFLEIEYPFLHQANYQDVLSSFFNFKEEPPNFVFIIVEGLGYKYLYNDYQLMPFLDSLSKQSLSWDNCLSVSSRTFGVLPAIFGAAPLGEKGFLDQPLFNPAHHNLISILNNNYYNSNFFQGCYWVDFDNIDKFIQQNNMLHIRKSDWDQDIKDEKLETFWWGYEDHLVYKQAHRILKKQRALPRIDVYLTLSTHDPFEYPRSEYFQNIVISKVNQNKSLSEQQKQHIIKFKKRYGSFAYSDWSIQQLMEEYQKRNDFDNTIFIITGDHDCGAGQFGGYTNYHVPLIIYSPMLKSDRRMKGVVSHRDITPTILSLLKKHYNIKSPDEVAWLNTKLDTSLTFNANTFAPLQIIDHTIEGVLYKNYMLSEGVLEEVTDGNSVTIDNQQIFQQMERLLYLYKSIDLYNLYNDALIKNDYAHKQKLTNVIIDIEDTIFTGSHYAEKSKLQVLEGPERKPTTLFFDASNKAPIYFLEFEIPESVESFRAEIEFSIFVRNAGEDGLYLCTDIKKRNKTLFSDHDKISYHDHNRWLTYKKSTLCKKESLSSSGKKGEYRIYIKNSEQLEGYIDDIKVRVVVNQ